MSARKLIAGNWKMNGLMASLEELRAMRDAVADGHLSHVDLLICTPATLVAAAAQTVGDAFPVGGQDCHERQEGAFTGNISATMLADAGATHVIVGHSERRTLHGETDALVRAKAEAARAAGLTAVICIGETEGEREAGQTLDVLGRQLAGSVPDGATAEQVVVAYEPVWAIGTGRTATAEQAQAVMELETRIAAQHWDKVTVRAVQREAGVRIGEVAAWMREHAAGAAGEVPEAPDLSEPMSAMVASVWAAAWKRAAEQADEATAVALDAARAGGSYVLTTGTGSGKSLAYIIPIVDHVLRSRVAEGPRRGVKAIIVYPMNALANSQMGELEKFLDHGFPPGQAPVRYKRYTGQEGEDERAAILADPPDILLTNYVMLELVLTRPKERDSLVAAAEGLRYLVLDELHSYRGRQGADVALLIRRVRDACRSEQLDVIGTSATMATGKRAEQAAEVARTASLFFGVEVPPERIIGETLVRSTTGDASDRSAIVEVIDEPDLLDRLDYDALAAHPIAAWVEDRFGLDGESDPPHLVRRRPSRIETEARVLASQTGRGETACGEALRRTLLRGSNVAHPRTGRPLFAFRLHQFLSKGDNVYSTIEPEGARTLVGTYQLRSPQDHGAALLPMTFCRECGQEYVIVTRRKVNGITTYTPASTREKSATTTPLSGPGVDSWMGDMNAPLCRGLCFTTHNHRHWVLSNTRRDAQ